MAPIGIRTEVRLRVPRTRSRLLNASSVPVAVDEFYQHIASNSVAQSHRCEDLVRTKQDRYQIESSLLTQSSRPTTALRCIFSYVLVPDFVQICLNARDAEHTNRMVRKIECSSGKDKNVLVSVQR
jgi:hypothetical protein